MLTVGIPKEIKPREKRVGLVPSAVGRLVEQGVPIYVESGAGLGSGYGDELYRKKGAEILADAKALYRQAQLIQKVKEPQASEYESLRQEHWLFCYLHLASPENCELVRCLCRTGLHAIGYETVEKENQLPLLAPMSEIAGGLAALYAAHLKSGDADGKGILPDLEKIARNYPRHSFSRVLNQVIIFGAGIAGMKAYELAKAISQKVFLMDVDPERIKRLKDQGVDCRSIRGMDSSILEEADVLIGCAHSPGKRAAKVLDSELLKSSSLHQKKILMDVSIDQGGNFPEARSTTYDDPVYQDEAGNVRFAVANLPSLCGPKASEALSQATCPYLLALAQDPQKALQQFPELQKGLNIADGKIQIPAIASAHQSS